MLNFIKHLHKINREKDNIRIITTTCKQLRWSLIILVIVNTFPIVLFYSSFRFSVIWFLVKLLHLPLLFKALLLTIIIPFVTSMLFIYLPIISVFGLLICKSVCYYVLLLFTLFTYANNHHNLVTLSRSSTLQLSRISVLVNIFTFYKKKDWIYIEYDDGKGNNWKIQTNGYAEVWKPK